MSRPARTYYGSSWNVHPGSDNTLTWEQVQAILLQEIRDELKMINQTLRCPDFQSMPRHLRQINTNTKKRKRKVVKK